MRGAFQLVTGPTSEPVTLDDAKAHLRVDTADDDPYIEDVVTIAREWLEEDYELAFIQQDWRYVLDAFPTAVAVGGQWIGGVWWRWIDIPRGPLMSVTSITYIDTQGNQQTLSTSVYQADTVRMPPRVALKAGQSWPSTNLDAINNVTMNLRLGYGADATAVPRRARQAIKLILGHFYENREENVVAERIRPLELPMGVQRLMRSLDWRSLVA